MFTNINKRGSGVRARIDLAGLTLVEVMISMAISAMIIGCTVTGYIFATASADKSVHSLAANAHASKRIEQSRAAKWDTAAIPAVDELVSSNFPPQVVLMDLPQAGGNRLYATNLMTITEVSANPPLKMIRVDCVWSHNRRGPFTNTMVTYRTAD